MKQFLVLVVCAVSFAWCAHDLSSYPFKITLNPAKNGAGLYELYWNFDNAEETISFAVRVQTTGWVGFGLSPNGQMPNSDVVIGWVTDEGQTEFQDRFATGRFLPAVDRQQNWILKGGEEENGFTILEFSRKYVTCDQNDLPITTETARVIWSFHNATDIPSGRHTSQGSLSLNLLGGLTDVAPDPQDLEHYDVTVDEIIIPQNDTTYWCAAFRLPENIRTQERYITKFSPRVTEGNDAHVHHLLVYLCDSINDTHVGNGGDCEEGVANEVAECRRGTLIAAWAVGGETFVYPNNVAFPFGGEGFPEYLVMELHYDNPDMAQGTVDSSGMRLWFTSTPREHEAGVLQIGHFVTEYQVIPPNSENFTTTGIVFEDCTNEFFPEEGIHVFANALHTHEVGIGLTVQHIRYNSDCDVYEELEPIDKNLQYDFDFQQINHLRREVTLMPGDILQLKCFYATKGLNKVTLGGLSTRDEMCLSFLFYYPKRDITLALSGTSERELTTYFSKFPPEIRSDFRKGLNSITWDTTAREDLQRFSNESEQFAYCGNLADREVQTLSKFPEIGCSYIPPDQCSESTPTTCCERITGTRAPTEDGVALGVSAALILSLSLLTTILG